MKDYEKLYKLDENNNIRVWWMQSDKNKIRACSGILNGKIVESGWKICHEKNIGKANHTSAIEQAEKEIEAKYTKQLKSEGYYRTIEEATAKPFRFHAPMLAHPYKKIEYEITEYISQPKSDGIRALKDYQSLKSRKGEDIISCSHIEEELNNFLNKNKNIVFDGELYNHSYRDDFNSIQSAVTTKKNLTEEKLKVVRELIQYHVYDFFDLDRPHLTMEDRTKYLEDYLSQFDQSIIKPVETTFIQSDIHADELFGKYLEDGYEGQMLRYRKSIYQHRRTPDLIKRKEMEDREFIILDVVEGVGNWAGYAKSLLVKFPESDVTFSSGIRGNFEFTKSLLENKENYIGTVVTINFQNLTPDGIPRFPVAVKFWGTSRDF